MSSPFTDQKEKERTHRDCVERKRRKAVSSLDDQGKAQEISNSFALLQA